MSDMRLWVVGLAALLACGTSFWGGQHFARGGGSAAAPPVLGTTPKTGISPATSGEEPDEMNCSQPPPELNARRKRLLPSLSQRAEKVEDINNGIRFRFAHKTKLVTELAALIEKERVCRSFLSFRLIAEKGEGPIALEVTGPPGAAEALRKL